MDEEGGPMSTSNSALSTYRSCALKYKLHYIDRLVPIGAVSRHDLDFGGAIAKGMEAYWTERSVSKAQAAFATMYPASSYPAELPKNSQGKTFDNGIASFAGYHARWAEDNQHWEILQVEQLENADDDDLQTVKLDLVMRDRRDDQVYGLDCKSTGSYLDNKYWGRYEPSSQIRSYVTHIKRKYGHCGGFYIDAISFKHRSKAYTPRVGPDKGVQQPAGDWHAFARMVYNPNSDCLRLEQDNFEYWVARIEQDRESGLWGYNDQACHQYGSECQFIKLCSNGYTFPRDEELVLSYYRQACPKVLPEGRCQLALDHEGDHDPTVAVQPDIEIELDEEIEEAVV